MNPTWKSYANKRSILFTHTPGLTEYNLDKPVLSAAQLWPIDGSGPNEADPQCNAILSSTSHNILFY